MQKPLYCTKCGTRLKENMSFCTNCGARVETPQAAIARPQSTAGPEPQAVDREKWITFAKDVYRDFQHNGGYTGMQVRVPFPPRFDRSEKRITVVPYQRMVYCATDVEYTKHYTGAVFAGSVRGTLGIMATLGAVNLARNYYNKRKAERESAAQWRSLDAGDMTVTDFGVYLNNGQAHTDNWYSGISEAVVTGWNTLEIVAHFESGQQRQVLITPAALTVFVLWCLAMYPEHYQLEDLLR
ncbi:MAG: zinc ribbon domain-containing protein [Clostridiales Family XIII bacterium]|nr:zinc ribbon domain-containing protein [Clostridiales Family XIII bacterium]